MAASIMVDRKPQERIDGDELFSTIINTKEILAHRYSDTLTYEDDFLIIGNSGDEDRSRAEDVIDLRIVGGGEGTEVNFYEGFVVDQNGRAVPFFSNMRAYNNASIVARNVRTGAIYNINSKDIDFKLQITDIEPIATSKQE